MVGAIVPGARAGASAEFQAAAEPVRQSENGRRVGAVPGEQAGRGDRATQTARRRRKGDQRSGLPALRAHAGRDQVAPARSGALICIARFKPTPPITSVNSATQKDTPKK